MTAVEDFYEYDDDFENFDFGDEIDDIVSWKAGGKNRT